jgi:hypothetical protein
LIERVDLRDPVDHRFGIATPSLRSTWTTNSFTRSHFGRPPRPNRPSTIWPVIEFDFCSAAPKAALSVTIGLSSDPARAQFRIFSVFETASSSIVELPFPDAAQIRQLGPQLKQLPQRLDLPGHLLGIEIVQALEIEVYFQLPSLGIFAQLVLNRVRHVRLHALQHAVEVVRGDLDESPVF